MADESTDEVTEAPAAAEAADAPAKKAPAKKAAGASAAAPPSDDEPF